MILLMVVMTVARGKEGEFSDLFLSSTFLGVSQLFRLRMHFHDSRYLIRTLS